MDINIHQAEYLRATVKEFCPEARPARFATLSLHNDRDDVTMFFTSLAEVEGLVERIQAALAERTVAPMTP